MENKAILSKLPPMLSGKQLDEALEVLPEWNPDCRSLGQAQRLIALSDLYHAFIPNHMTREIYTKLYLALLRSLQKKQGKEHILQAYSNYQRDFCGIVGGADSFTIIGASGIGKSTSISHAVQLLSAEKVISVEEPHTKIIPCVVVQCPFDSSVKGLLLEILRVVDDVLGSSYYPKASSIRATTDMLIGTVSQVAINHIGILIVDEIQNVVISKNGRNLLGVLLQLINCSGISICMVGTPECTEFFTQAMQLARRSLGLEYQAMAYDGEFIRLCKTFLKYQYVQNPMEEETAIIPWLFEHSGGNISTVVTLLHDAQEIAILDGSEELTLQVLTLAYQCRVKMLHSFIQPTKKPQTKRMCQRRFDLPATREPDDFSIYQAAQQAKKGGKDVLSLLRKSITIEEVAV